MIVLFVAHHVNHLVDGEILIAELSRADVLGHVDGSAVSAEQQLMVETVACQVGGTEPSSLRYIIPFSMPPSTRSFPSRYVSDS